MNEQIIESASYTSNQKTNFILQEKPHMRSYV